jgi:hypothetical protein
MVKSTLLNVQMPHAPAGCGQLLICWSLTGLEGVPERKARCKGGSSTVLECFAREPLRKPGMEQSSEKYDDEDDDLTVK